jgi:F-type H+-transporting ATPase subunit gamma
VSARRELERRLAGLREIRSIMHSMESLAFMESRKLERLLQSQQQLVATIDRAAHDLLQHHPELLPVGEPPLAIMLLLGSARGFCGDFNETLLRADLSASGMSDANRILVGRRLQLQAEADEGVLAALEGADVAEDIAPVLEAIVTTVNEQRVRRGPVALAVCYHDGEATEPVQRQLLPPWRADNGSGAPRTFPPLLNLAPRAMFGELVDHYLLAALQEVLLASLKAENQRRARHLNGAVNRLDERIEELQNRGQQLRQEEITEEIEVILLSAGETYGTKSIS